MRQAQMRRQRSIRGGRDRGGYGLEPHLYTAMLKTCKRFGSSVPLYLSTLVADAEGIDLEARDRFDAKPAHINRPRLLKRA